MDVFAWMVVGVVAGVLCQLVIPGKALGGFVGDLFAGVVGALFGGYLIMTYHMAHFMNHYLLWTVAVSFSCAATFLILARTLSGRQQPGAEDSLRTTKDDNG